MNKKFSVKERIYSFKYAFDGLRVLLKDEHNMRIHFVLSIIAIVLGILLEITLTEWMFICLAIVMVISMEAVNSSIENLADFISPDRDERIKKVKDMSAFAVLFCAFGSLIIGCVIFLPKIIALFQN